MTFAVYDANVVVSATFWPGAARRCLKAVAARHVRLFVTEAILEEYQRTAEAVRRRRFPDRNPVPMLSWIESTARLVKPAPLGKRRSRDVTDDPYLAAALAARAPHLVSYDNDLLVLEKPFGIQILRPAAFLTWLRSGEVE